MDKAEKDDHFGTTLEQEGGSSEVADPGFRARLQALIADEKPFAWAARVGISKGAFSRIWGKGSVPTSELLKKIAAATGVNLHWLLTGEGDMWRGGAASGAGGPSGVDEQLLEAAISAVEEVLEEKGLEVKADKKAQLISTLYEMAQEEGAKVERATVLRLVRLAA